MALAAGRPGSAWARRGVYLAGCLLLLILLPALGLVHEIYFERSGLPDLERFLRFELPTTGEVRDARGDALIELARGSTAGWCSG